MQCNNIDAKFRKSMATLAAEVYFLDTDQPWHPYFEFAKKIVGKG